MILLWLGDNPVDAFRLCRDDHAWARSEDYSFERTIRVAGPPFPGLDRVDIDRAGTSQGEAKIEGDSIVFFDGFQHIYLRNRSIPPCWRDPSGWSHRIVIACTRRRR